MPGKVKARRGFLVKKNGKNGVTGLGGPKVA